MAQSDHLIGQLSLHFEGYGFVVPTKPGLPDVFIPARLIGDALHGDLIEVKIKPSKKGLFEGEVVRILKRGLIQLVGTLEQHGKKWILLALDTRVKQKMVIPNFPAGFKHGDNVVAKILRYPEGNNPLEGEVIEKLPPRGTLLSEIEYVIAKHQLPKGFPNEVLVEAEKISREPRTKNQEPRTDLRHLPFVTIDGEDAKDFDDAVCAKPLEGNRLQIWVAIADVSHYVRPGSPIDQEAYARATSVYFPGRVLPMLPEVLSNDLCSLKPAEERLALVAEWILDSEGEVSEEKFYPALFQSHARLTYQILKKILEDKEKESIEMYQSLVPMLERLSEAARYLKAKRSNKGSLDFDLPEPEILLDFTGGITDIEKSERYWSHQIIEELMIAANEAVARFLTKKKVGCIYRIHEGPNPEKISSFFKLVNRLGYRGKFPTNYASSAGGSPDGGSKGLMKILHHFKGHAEERLVNTLLLRSMSQAVYSATNIGHYGLASPCYCHFTSPIRRYPDLVVHRLLKKALQRETSTHQHINTSTQLSETAEQSSILERKSMGAEREMLSLHQTMFMQDKKDLVFDGIISHVTRFGFFVELLEFFVEGLVSKEQLKGDHYIFDQEHLAFRGKHKHKIFKIGERVKVAVGEANIPERKIYFKLLS